MNKQMLRNYSDRELLREVRDIKDPIVQELAFRLEILVNADEWYQEGLKRLAAMVEKQH